jgi:glycerol uptake facilitator-like aquaporin
MNTEEQEFYRHYILEKESVYELTKQSLLILTFECIGTMLLTLFYQSCTMHYNPLGFTLGVLCVTVMSVKSTGAHYNPAITMVFLCKKKQRVSSRWLGVGYLIFQFAGALFGAMAFLAVESNSVGVEVLKPGMWPQALASEALCAFLLIFIYVSQAHYKTKITDDPVIFSLLIALTYSVCIYFITYQTSVYFSPVNPATSIAI